MPEKKRPLFSFISSYFRKGKVSNHYGTASNHYGTAGSLEGGSQANRAPGRLENGQYLLALQPAEGISCDFKARSQVTYILDSGMDEKRYGVGFDYDISSVFSRNKAGLLIAELQFKRANGGTVLNEGFTSTDTEDDEGDRVHWGIMWDIVQNSHLAFTLGPRGETKSVKGESAMLRQLIKRINAEDPAKLPLDLKSWNSWIMQGTLRRLPMRMFQLFPEGAVNENKTWTLALNEPGVVPIEVISTCSIEGLKGNVLHLKTAGPISCRKTPSDLFYEPSTWTLKGRENGSYALDLHTGLLLHGNLKGSAEGFYTYYKKEVPARMEYELSIECRTNASGQQINI